MNIQIESMHSLIDATKLRLSHVHDALTAVQSQLKQLDLELSEAQTQVIAPPSLADRLLLALKGEHKLRTMDALTVELSATREDIISAANHHEICFVLRRRIQDGAELIGLAERN